MFQNICLTFAVYMKSKCVGEQVGYLVQTCRDTEGCLVKINRWWLKCVVRYVAYSEFQTGNCMFKVNNRNTRKRCEIFSKLTIKIPERHHWRRSGNFIVNFEHISHLVLVFLLLSRYQQGWLGPCGRIKDLINNKDNKVISKNKEKNIRLSKKNVGNDISI